MILWREWRRYGAPQPLHNYTIWSTVIIPGGDLLLCIERQPTPPDSRIRVEFRRYKIDIDMRGDHAMFNN